MHAQLKDRLHENNSCCKFIKEKKSQISKGNPNYMAIAAIEAKNNVVSH